MSPSAIPSGVRESPRSPAASAEAAFDDADHKDPFESQSSLASLTRIDLNPEAELLGVTRVDDLRDDSRDHASGDGESDASARAALAEDHRVHPDEHSRRVEQGPARVSRIDGRVGLDHVSDRHPADPFHLTPERADDAGRQRVIESEGISDGDRLLPDFERHSRVDHVQRASACLGGTSILMTAMSLRGSTPMIRAGYVFCELRVTVSARAPCTTWKLVTMVPASSQAKPEPEPAGTSVAVRWN
jgi:hypothetical protein